MTSAFRIGVGDAPTGPWTWFSYDEPATAQSGQWCKVELESTAGVSSIACECPSGDEHVMSSGQLPDVTINTLTKTGVFQLADIGAQTVVVRVTANPYTPASSSKELSVSVPLQDGQKLAAVDETDQGNRTYGWTQKLNDAMRGGPRGNESFRVAKLVTVEGHQDGSCELVKMPEDAFAHVVARFVAAGEVTLFEFFYGSLGITRLSGATAISVPYHSIHQSSADITYDFDIDGNTVRVLFSNDSDETVTIRVALDVVMYSRSFE